MADLTKWADYSDQVTGDQLDAALRAGGFFGVLHYLAGTPGFARRIEDPAVVADIRARGWPQQGIDIPVLGAVNGPATASRVAGVYGFGPGFTVYLDIEPDQYRQNPDAWPSKANAWCDALRAQGFIPGVYGTDATLAACSNHAERIWRADPGECDPAGPGLDPAFFAGRRMIQCGLQGGGGVSFDFSYSQYEVDMPLSDGLKVGLAHVAVKAIYQREPTQQEEFDLANAINADGSNFADLVQQLSVNAQNPDGVRLANETLATRLDNLAPAGAGGVPAHSHALSGTTGPVSP